MMKRGVRSPHYLIDINSIKNLNYIKFDEKNGLKIGALTKICQLERSEEIKSRLPVVADAASSIASPQIRNVATVAGNLVQEVWCWYLLEGYDCWLNKGKYCYAPEGDNRFHHSILGGNLCFAVHPSDLAPVLTALDARITVQGASESRIISPKQLLPGFFKRDGNVEQNALEPDEIITEIRIEPLWQEYTGVFLKHAVRKSFDFALSSVTLLALVKEDLWEDVRIVLGGIGNTPYRAEKLEEALRGKRLTEELVTKAVEEKTFQKTIPLVMNAYRVRLTTALVKRAIGQVLQPGT